MNILVNIIFVTEDDRDETEACEANTPGCAVNHTASDADASCEGW
jgi:hypothetical protein